MANALRMVRRADAMLDGAGILVPVRDDAVERALVDFAYVPKIRHIERGPKWSYLDMTEETKSRRIMRRRRMQ